MIHLLAGLTSSPVVGWEALGFTVAAGMFFVAGALGAWARAVVSDTQVVLSQRTVVDLLVGGAWGILLPLFSPILDRVLGIHFLEWSALQQAVLAFLAGGGGTWLTTAIGWRTGIILTPQQDANGGKTGKPEAGVLRGTTKTKEAPPPEPLKEDAP